MSISNQARIVRTMEMRAQEGEILVLYRQQKSDQDIAEALHIRVGLVRATRDSMGLPPWRSYSGRLFTMEVDTRLLAMRDEKGLPFRVIGETLGYAAADLSSRYTVLKRLESKRAPNPYKTVVACLLCGQGFLSEDRRKFRFCRRCKTNELPKLDCSPFDPDDAGGSYIAHAAPSAA